MLFVSVTFFFTTPRCACIRARLGMFMHSQGVSPTTFRRKSSGSRNRITQKKQNIRMCICYLRQGCFPLSTTRSKSYELIWVKCSGNVDSWRRNRQLILVIFQVLEGIWPLISQTSLAKVKKVKVIKQLTMLRNLVTLPSIFLAWCCGARRAALRQLRGEKCPVDDARISRKLSEDVSSSSKLA